MTNPTPKSFWSLLSKTSLFLFGIVCITSTASGQGVISIDLDFEKEISIEKDIRLYADYGKKLDVEDAIQIFENEKKIVPLKGYEFPNILSFHKYYFWLKFDLENSSDEQKNILLEIPYIDSLVLYQYNEGNLYGSSIFGYKTLIKDQPFQLLNDYNSTEVCPISLGSGQKYTFYVRCSKDIWKRNSFEVKLISEKEYLLNNYELDLDYYFVSCLFLGVVFFTFLFFLFQYFQNNDLAFLFYASYLFFIFLYYWREFEYYSSLHNVVFGYHLTNISFIRVPLDSGIYVSYFLFIYFFFGREELKNIKHLIFWGIGVTVIYTGVQIILTLTNIPLVYFIHGYFRFLLFIFSIFFFYKLLSLTHPLNFWILSGSLSLLLLGGLIPLGITYFYGDIVVKGFDLSNLIARFGILTEVMLFSLGLGLRTKLLERDKVESERALEEQERKSVELKELENLKNEFFEDVSHEFRTPLMVIKGLGANLEEEVARTDHLNKLKTIGKNADQILDLINQILCLAKMDSNNAILNLKQENCVPIIEYLVDSFHAYALDKGITLRCHCVEKVIMMDLDRENFSSVIRNLLSNSLKFTPHGGKITLNVKPILVDGDSFLKIEIEDNGIGVSKEDLPFIFDRFYKASNPNNSGGTGIGLSFVRGMVGLLEGEIEVKSIPFQSTVFTIILPIKNEKPLAKSKPLRLNTSDEKMSERINRLNHGKSKLPSIFLIDDNISIINYLGKRLSNDFQLHVALDGMEAYSRILEIEPDIIISDVMMPHLNGIELCKRLKSNPQTNHIPIILMTAKAGIDNELDGLSAGASGYLTKPFKEEKLILMVKNLIHNTNRVKNIHKENSLEQFINEIFLFCKDQINNESSYSQNSCKLLLSEQFNFARTRITISQYERVVNEIGFSMSVLLCYVIQQRLLGREQINSQKLILNTIPLSGSGNDKDISFLRDSYQKITTHIHQPGFNVRNLSFLVIPENEKSNNLDQQRNTLGKKIKRILGITPTQFLFLIRMDKARILLKENGENYQQVAHKVGYKSTTKLRKEFLNYFEKNQSMPV